MQIAASASKNVIAAGLSFPTAITHGPDRALQCQNGGSGGRAPGLGQNLRITVPN